MNNKERYKLNPEKYKKQALEYYHRNIEKCRQREREKSARTKDTPKYIYRWYKYCAKKRGYEFSLTFQEFNNFWNNNCYYCNEKVKTIGLDRMDNSKGYVLDNVVSCCRHCNIMKNKYTYKSFINQCKLIVNNISVATILPLDTPRTLNVGGQTDKLSPKSAE